MMKVKMNNVNYQVYTDEKNKTVVAVCRYAGRNVRAVAKCSPEDTFNEMTGIKLAITRCEIKAAKLKIKNAAAKYLEAAKAADEAERRFDKMKQYYMDSVDHLDEMIEEHNKLINEIK